VLAIIPGYAPAQGYEVGWFTVDGGGGASSGGEFSISGTIGQPDAGLLSGGGFTIEGGFWSDVSIIQATGAPPLSIQPAGSNAIVSWPVGVAGFSLEESAMIDNGVWSTTPQAILDTATKHTVTVPVVSVRKIYRLKK
jgi:hypothetical protein